MSIHAKKTTPLVFRTEIEGVGNRISTKLHNLKTNL